MTSRELDPPNRRPILSPDCRAEKCGACVGDAWHPDRDERHPCECSHHPGGWFKHPDRERPVWA